MTLIVEAEEPSTISSSAYGKARSTIEGSPLSSDELRKITSAWRSTPLTAFVSYRGLEVTRRRNSVTTRSLPRLRLQTLHGQPGDYRMEMAAADRVTRKESK
jgi:hypothetical protein